MKRFLKALAVALSLVLSLAVQAQMPQPPEVAAKAYLLIDMTANQVLAAKETDMAVARYKREGDQYDVIVQTATTGRDTPDDIERVFVRGKGDAMIPLSALVKTKEVVVPRELNHFSQRLAHKRTNARASRVTNSRWVILLKCRC